jgi:flavin reductase (DIM6/NTAB) family NADH-FMN oxidoreductase RutF
MVNERPPKIVLSVGLKSLTYELIARSNQFGINVPTLSAHPDHISLETIIKCSNDIATDRKENDQFGVLGLTKLPATFFGMKVPLIGECVAHVECSVIGKTDEIGDHVVFWGTVLAASAVEGCLDQEGYFSSLLTFPILQDLGRGHFSSICGWMEFEKK